jgi:DNA polymerase I-like protein with 3'-5' exonuclease and polymerase domains
MVATMPAKKLKTNIGGEQLLLITPPSDWKCPSALPNLQHCARIAIDLETKDDGLASGRGPGWATGEGYVCGISIAWRDNTLHSRYFPIKHQDTPNCFPVETIARWLKFHQDAGIQFTFHNGGYDTGWICRQFNLRPTYKIDDTACMAYMVDEGRLNYSLNSLCKWRGLAAKDERILRDAAAAYGINPKNEMWKLPARYVGQYAEQDALCTLLLAENLEPEIAEVKEAYRLEMDLLPMVHAMRERGICIDSNATQRAYTRFKNESKFALADLGRHLGEHVTIDNIRSNDWLESRFKACNISFPRTVKTNRGSFQAPWMKKYDHWLPQLIVRAKQFEDAAEKFIKTYIMDFQYKGRIHASINQYRSENVSDEDKYGGGTRTYRFSYSDPPLQQIPNRNEELAKEIRGCFIPEKYETWMRADFSQQEFRLMVHYADSLNLSKAAEAAEKYRNDPETDFHQMVADMTGLGRKPAKDCNFAKAYGAGVMKFAKMIGQSKENAEAIMAQYDVKLPFVKELSHISQQSAQKKGYIRLLDGARIHFDHWVAAWRQEGVTWTKENNMADCNRQEAERRVADPSHPWYRQPLRRSRCNKAMNSLIQGGAARQTKVAMRACWQAGYTPLLQLHDELNFSLPDRKMGNEIAELMCNAVPLRIPMKVDLAFGSSWAG